MPFVPIVPAERLLLLHVPPADASLKLVVSPTQTFLFPKIAVGKGFTVAIVVTKQLVGKVYVIVALLVTPTAPPVTQPPVPTVATPALLLLHAPPLVASVRQTFSPLHTGALPVIGAGSGLTVKVVVEIVVPQELVTLYVIVVVPPPLPVVVTTPNPASIVATPVLLLLHPVPVPADVVLWKIVAPL